jgi:hypothetical protein
MPKHRRRTPPSRLAAIAATCAVSASLAVLLGTGALWLLRPDTPPPPSGVPAVVKTVPAITVTVPVPPPPPLRHTMTVEQHR